MEELIKQYRESLENVNMARFTATPDDKRLLAGCADSLLYSIEFMDLGKEPGNRRSITNRSKSQRTISKDPNDYAFLKAAVINRKASENLSVEQRELLDDLLATLTAKQREAFIMVRGSGYSFAQAAKIMGIKETSVQNHVERAEKKMRIIATKDKKSGEITVNKPLQCVMFA